MLFTKNRVQPSCAAVLLHNNMHSYNIIMIVSICHADGRPGARRFTHTACALGKKDIIKKKRIKKKTIFGGIIHYAVRYRTRNKTEPRGAATALYGFPKIYIFMITERCILIYARSFDRSTSWTVGFGIDGKPCALFDST